MNSKFKFFAPSDIYKLKIPNEVQLSPDGQKIAIVIQYWDKEKNKSLTKIKVIFINSKKEKTINFGEINKYPRWASDSKKLAFLTKIKNKNKIAITNIEDNKPWYFETECEVVSQPYWSNDDSKIAFLAFEKKSNCSCNYNSNNKNKITVIKKLYHKYDDYGFFEDTFQHIYIGDIDNNKNSVYKLSYGDINHFSPAWSPGGKYITCSVIREDNLEKGVYKNVLVKYELETGNFETLFSNYGPIRALSWSPDGKKLAYIGHQNKYGRATTKSLWLYYLKNNKLKNCTKTFDRLVGESIDTDFQYSYNKTIPIQWSENSQKIYFIAINKGGSYIYKYSLEHNSVTKLLENEEKAIHYFTLSHRMFAYIASTHNDPGEVFIKKDNKIIDFTSLNFGLKNKIKFFPAKKINYKGVNDWPIDGWIVNSYDSNSDKKNPLIVIVHGGPHLAYGNNFMIQSQVLAANGYTVFYANPRGSEGYGQKFTSAVVKDWGNNDCQDIIQGVREVINRGKADPDRIGITGWSYGGYISAWLIAQTDLFKAAVIGGCVSNLYSFYGTSDIGYSFGEFETGGTSYKLNKKLIARSPVNYANKINIPVLILHGEEDLRCPISQSEELFTVINRCNGEAVMVRYPEERHILQKPSHIIDKLERMINWFNKNI